MVQSSLTHAAGFVQQVCLESVPEMLEVIVTHSSYHRMLPCHFSCLSSDLQAWNEETHTGQGSGLVMHIDIVHINARPDMCICLEHMVGTNQTHQLANSHRHDKKRFLSQHSVTVVNPTGSTQMGATHNSWCPQKTPAQFHLVADILLGKTAL